MSSTYLLPPLSAAATACWPALLAHAGPCNLPQNVVLPSRIVHLPMAWEEKWTRDAIDKYMRSGRPEAPYLPSNIQ